MVAEIQRLENAARIAMGDIQDPDQTTLAIISPGDLGLSRIGHFDLFHERCHADFWRASADWLARRGQGWDLGTITPGSERLAGNASNCSARERGLP
jgi:hypothetical protein